MSLTIQNNTRSVASLFGTEFVPAALILSAAVITAGKVSRGLILAYNTSTNKTNDFVIGGANGTGTPVAVVNDDIALPAGALAGDELDIMVIASGTVRRDVLMTSAGGTATDAICVQLRDTGIVAQYCDDVSVLDNQ